MIVYDYEFCKYHPQEHRLCVFRHDRWIVETVWINYYEDIFRITGLLTGLPAKTEVKKMEFGELPVKTEHGDIVHIPCLYIDT